MKKSNPYWNLKKMIDNKQQESKLFSLTILLLLLTITNLTVLLNNAVRGLLMQYFLFTILNDLIYTHSLLRLPYYRLNIVLKEL